MADHAFCRCLLKGVMEDVRKAVPAEAIKKAWGYRLKMFSKDHMEFHGPDGFYWHGQGCCVWYAKAQGWQAYLRKLEEEATGA